MKDPVIEYERYEYKLNNGVTVLAKLTKYGVSPITYANRTQAQRAAERENGDVVRYSRPFYVRLDKAHTLGKAVA